MTLRYNPETCWPRSGRAFNHGVIAPDGHTLYMTGQVAWDATGEIVGKGDCAAQILKCFEGVETVLSCVGGRLEDIVSLTIYFTDPADLPVIQSARAEKFSPETSPASILIQVPGLVAPGLLVELVPIAVVPPHRFRSPEPPDD